MVFSLVSKSRLAFILFLALDVPQNFIRDAQSGENWVSLLSKFELSEANDDKLEDFFGFFYEDEMRLLEGAFSDSYTTILARKHDPNIFKTF